LDWIGLLRDWIGLVCHEGLVRSTWKCVQNDGKMSTHIREGWPRAHVDAYSRCTYMQCH
jgi:hypothetical protein